MKQYQDMLRFIMKNGIEQDDRTGTGTIGLPGYTMRFNLQKGLPVVTTKKIHLKSVIYELLFFISGETNIKSLQENGVKIWDSWGEDGELGPTYGHQWRKYGQKPFGTLSQGIDQINYVLELLRSNPNSRRMVVSAWNPVDLDYVALTWCHCLFQLTVWNGKLTCHVYQRSCDAFLGCPFNITSYALLTHMLAQQADLAVGELIWTGGHVHIYKNHLEQVEEQLSREPRPLPILNLHKAVNIDNYRYEDFKIVGYDPWSAIKAEVSV